MSGWEIFTWLCTGILGLGSIVVFILFIPAVLYFNLSEDINKLIIEVRKRFLDND